MKRGDIVAVCYDGKWGRRVRGEVLRSRNGHHILVRHALYAGEKNEIVNTWFRRVDHGRHKRIRRYAGWVRRDDALMPMLFDAPGDWYSVCKWKE